MRSGFTTSRCGLHKRSALPLAYSRELVASNAPFQSKFQTHLPRTDEHQTQVSSLNFPLAPPFYILSGSHTKRLTCLSALEFPSSAVGLVASPSVNSSTNASSTQRSTIVPNPSPQTYPSCRLSPDSIKWNHKITHVDRTLDPTTGAIRMTLSHSHGNSTPPSKSPYDLIIGADGAWSRVRPLLTLTPTPTLPTYSGTQFLTFTIRHVSTKFPHLLPSPVPAPSAPSAAATVSSRSAGPWTHYVSTL